MWEAGERAVDSVRLPSWFFQRVARSGRVALMGKPPKSQEGSSYPFCHLAEDVRPSARKGEARAEPL